MTDLTGRRDVEGTLWRVPWGGGGTKSCPPGWQGLKRKRDACKGRFEKSPSNIHLGGSQWSCKKVSAREGPSAAGGDPTGWLIAKKPALHLCERGKMKRCTRVSSAKEPADSSRAGEDPADKYGFGQREKTGLLSPGDANGSNAIRPRGRASQKLLLGNPKRHVPGGVLSWRLEADSRGSS